MNSPQEQVAVYMYGLDGVQKGDYFVGKQSRTTEVEVTGKAACKDEITGEMIKGGGEMVVD